MSFLYEEDNQSPAEEQNQSTVTQSFQKPDHARRRVEQECHSALSESIRIAAETNRLAQATAEELQLQSEQIQRIHRDSEATRDNLRTSEFLLKGMKGWWSSLTQLFQEPPKPKASQVHPREHLSNCNNGSGLDLVQLPDHIDTKLPLAETSKDMSAGLSQLSRMLEEMKHRAIVTGRELEYQNKELEIVQALTSGNDEMLDKQRRELERLMK
eukprot:Gregarina_sp_Poly_1__9753@NODE_620_length_7097_cov_138_674395_g475_i0_p4_GENE_NODE_620_length_7097_cov_138_674395_g475_i0NODE_620_length_7097_cov_138_674395_g475_i0_p4_ORF_typecomplete_len213_score31_64VSNARE_C/PF12352_8/3_8e09VSNARE_C/PF12352_8/31DUF5089/PF17002_5/0_00098Laminin_I/PF06008_14/0_018Laminin_I/PF06008_14/7_3Sec20/PF03908_13/0_021Sec20/PF03908_13/2e02AAA_30/PF13604_6/0_057PEPcase/PF00311_17/6_6PEPcase/PF00311_17/5_7FUSC/PF04632_12/1_4WEMBL/PF05701_11/27WEMBL/PF05701_11/2_1ING/PF1299